jgi:hypothetical protein
MAKEIKRVRDTHELERVERGSSHDGERNVASKGDSRSGEGRGTVKSGRQKKQSEKRALTFWSGQREGRVRIAKETEQVRGTHNLGRAEAASSQDGERNGGSKGHSLSGEGRGGSSHNGKINGGRKEHSPSGKGRRRDKSGW